MRLRLLLPCLVASLAIAAGCTKDGDGKAKVEIVGTVNEEPITVAEVLTAMGAARRERPEAPRDPEAEQRRRRHLVDELVHQKLLEQSARQHGIRIPEEEVERAILRMRADYPREFFDELLSAEGLTMAGLRDRLRGQLQLERLFAEEVFARVAITDDEVDAWLEANPDALRRPEQVHALQLVVKTEEEAKELLGQLRKGADFGKLAAEHSLSPDAKLGGDLGWFARGEMPPPFDEVCFALGVGRLSDVVGSSFGFHVFKVLERRGAQAPDPEELREEAEARLRREKEADAQRAYLAELIAGAQIRIDDAALARLVVKP